MQVVEFKNKKTAKFQKQTIKIIARFSIIVSFKEHITNTKFYFYKNSSQPFNFISKILGAIIELRWSTANFNRKRLYAFLNVFLTLISKMY